jgi:hypothetical protein
MTKKGCSSRFGHTVVARSVVRKHYRKRFAAGSRRRSSFALRVLDELAKSCAYRFAEKPCEGAIEIVLGNQLNHVGEVSVRSAHISFTASNLDLDQPRQ